MSVVRSAAESRHHLVRALEADLVGPYEEGRDELLELPPSRWYLTGFLAPAEARESNDPTDDDDFTDAGEDDDDETASAEPEAKQRAFFPASLGMSLFLPRTGGESIFAEVSFADYVAEEVAVTTPKRGRKPIVWRRFPRGPVRVEVPLVREALANGIRVGDYAGLELVGKLGETRLPGDAEPVRALSLFLVNRRPNAEQGRRDESFIFQVKLAVECPMGVKARPNRRDEGSEDPDENVADLQYRERAEWAVGHNVAIHVPSVAKGEAVRRIETTWIPRAEVRPVRTNDTVPIETSMEALADLPDAATARERLAPLLDAYGEWIAAQRTIDVGSPKRREVQTALLNDAEYAKRRIADGLALLAEDSEVFDSFRLANRAMAMSARARSPERYPEGKAPTWRVFQLAFLLLNLRGLADPSHADRENVELIFFPTGGGKTEAYLGVIAFTLILRRLRGRGRPDRGLGTAVLLRYTLRLLTLDQLGRAATLVCALERLREDRKDSLGDARFSVGLWVGRSATANTLAQVKDKILEYKNSAAKNAPSPCPLTNCPWCGAELGKASLLLVPRTDRVEGVAVVCLDPNCAFSEKKTSRGLPLLFVDEQIYRELPSFLVATVDKFAMLPWRGETGMLFGRVDARLEGRFFGPLDDIPKGAARLPEGNRPPELIVQDELHLISGPLGTMVGLYETAVEWLADGPGSEGRRFRPKIVGSTATVRRAREQIQALFGRTSMAQFPPPGVNAHDTFFAKVADADDAEGRLYVGVAAPGRAMKPILLRSYVALLTAARKCVDDPENPGAADAYTTLVGYFNSLRELGGMRRLVEDDVRVRSSQMERRVPANRVDEPCVWFKNRTIQAEPVELTSRESTGAIAKAKARLASRFGSPGAVDVVLASNMISVGVDIDRLGLMVVAGQPKTTSEYIQASSRVGRQWPGLVVTCFNVRKPRDRSHYERFVAYHESFYRFVEAQSLTPFSGPALDRGLAGTLVAMTRLSEPSLTPPLGAMKILSRGDVGEAAARALAARASRQPFLTVDIEKDRLAARVLDRAQSLLHAWNRIASTATKESGGGRPYSRFDKGAQGKAILFTAIDEEKPERGTDDARFAAPTSMRDVEPSVHLWLARRHLGGRN